MKQILVNPKEGKIILEDVLAPLCKDKGVLIRQYFVIFKIIRTICGSSTCD